MKNRILNTQVRDPLDSVTRPVEPNQASEALKRNAAEIMKRWEQRANDEVLSALKLESLALQNSLPQLLDQITDALSTSIDRTAVRIKWDRKESLRVGKQHGRERAASLTYTMDQMIFEYHILRQVICDVLEEERPLSPVEREVIVCAIKQGVNDAATQFSETLREIREKLNSTLHHDLRSPITSAKISAEMILRRPEDAELCVKAAGRIAANMNRLDSMIRDLLDVSLIQAGRQLPLQFEECDLNKIVEQIAEDFNFTYGDRFEVQSEPSVKGFWNEVGVRRIVENLATNAEKYGSPNTRITIAVLKTDQKVQVSVHNEGNPIPHNEQAILFEQFRRSLSAQNQAGWGIGLTVVKGLVEGHRGTVRLESSESSGTTFVIELPTDSRRI